MHSLFLILKHHPHLELEWLCTTLGLGVLGAITLDLNAILLALIALMSTFILALFTFLTARANAGLKKIDSKVDATNAKVDEYHKATNSKMDEYIAEVKKSFFAEGHLAGVEQERQRKLSQEADVAKGIAIEKKQEEKK